MDYLPDIAALSMDLKAAQFSQQYAVAIEKQAMDLQEIAAREITDMMPQVNSVPVIPKGDYIDVYA